jgi:hypothetical protein
MPGFQTVTPSAAAFEEWLVRGEEPIANFSMVFATECAEA